MKLTRYVVDRYGGSSITIDPTIRTVTIGYGTMQAKIRAELVEDVEILQDLDICEPWKVLTKMKEAYGDGPVYSCAKSYKTVARVAAYKPIGSSRIFYMLSPECDKYTKVSLDAAGYKGRGDES